MLTLLSCLPLPAGAEAPPGAAVVVRLEVVAVTPDAGRLRKQVIAGSGVLISAEGHLLTNYHVVRQPVRATAWLADGRKRRATVVGTDAGTDLAVLRLVAETAGESFPAATFAEGAALRAGDRVWAVGSPGNLSQAVTAGIVAHPALTLPDERTLPLIDGERVGRLVRWVAHDAAIFPGNSGGPLMDADGRIVGINEISVAGLGGAIPAALARHVAAELIAHGRVERAWLGVEWQPAAAGEPGVRAATVWPGGPAAQAGVAAGDTITGIGGRPVAAATAEALVSVAQIEEALTIGIELELAGWRGGTGWTRSVRPAARPAARAAPVELPAWGVVVRDVTPLFAWENGLGGAEGVWVESVRPGGRLGQAKPALRRQDRITAVAGRPVRTLDELRTALWSADGAVVVEFERERGTWVALLGEETGGSASGRARRGWLGVEVQVLERPLAEKLGVPGGAALRVTEVWAGTAAERAGLRPGDVVLAVDGERPEVRRAEDAGALAAMVRARRPGGEASLTLWRARAEVRVAVAIEAQPLTVGEVEKFDWPELELTLRWATPEDRRAFGLDPEVAAVVVAQVESAGWAELAGLAAGDLVRSVNGQPVGALAQFAAWRKERDGQSAPGPVDILAQRGRYRTIRAVIE